MVFPTLPEKGDNNWDVPINNALTNLDGRVTTLEGLNETTVPPTTPTSAGWPGQVASDETYLYVCVSENLWVRVLRESWA